MPSRRRFPPTTRPATISRALPHAEVGAALRLVRGSGAYCGTVLSLEFLVLTACRSGEVGKGLWVEIDLDAAVWAIPAERMKTRRVHRVRARVRSPYSTRGSGSWATAATSCSRTSLRRTEGCGPTGRAAHTASDWSVPSTIRRAG